MEDVYEITFGCPQCEQETIEISADLFDTLYQRGCGECGSHVMTVKRCRLVFGKHISDPEDSDE